MSKFPASKRSGGKPRGFLNARLTKQQLLVSTSIKLDDGSYENQETQIRAPRRMRVRIASSQWGPYRISRGERADYSLMRTFPEARDEGWGECPEDFDEGVRIEVDIDGIGRVTWTSNQKSVVNMLWGMAENWHDTAPEYRADQEAFVFTGWKRRTNPVSGDDYYELKLEPDVGQGNKDASSSPSPSSPSPSSPPPSSPPSPPRRGTPTHKDDRDINDAIPF
jgi:hypothetical protein